MKQLWNGRPSVSIPFPPLNPLEQMIRGLNKESHLSSLETQKRGLCCGPPLLLNHRWDHYFVTVLIQYNILYIPRKLPRGIDVLCSSRWLLNPCSLFFVLWTSKEQSREEIGWFFIRIWKWACEGRLRAMFLHMSWDCVSCMCAFSDDIGRYRTLV